MRPSIARFLVGNSAVVDVVSYDPSSSMEVVPSCNASFRAGCRALGHYVILSVNTRDVTDGSAVLYPTNPAGSWLMKKR